MLEEFRRFVTRGNVIDLAVGIVIGAAFATVVTSFVDDILMPPIGWAFGGVDFSNLFLDLSGGNYSSLAEAKEAGAPTINYGLFISKLISFLIVAFAVFLVVHRYNRLRTVEEVAPLAAPERECPYCRMRVPHDAVRCAHCTSELPLEPLGA